MTQQDQSDIEAWLDDARRALSPRTADQARVLAALEQRLDLAPEPGEFTDNLSEKHLHAEPASAGQLALGSARLLVRRFLRAPLQVVLPVAGMAAIALVATQLHPRELTPSLHPLKPVAAAVTSHTEPVDTPQLAAASEPQPLDRTEGKYDKSEPPKKKPQRKKCRAANGQERPCDTKITETALALAPAEPAAPPPAAASLREELEALRQAQSALRNGQAAQALAVLEAFERQASGPGAMQEERAAAATMARCALAQAQPDKSALYSEFVQHYPKSAYAARLRRTCVTQP